MLVGVVGWLGCAKGHVERRQPSLVTTMLIIRSIVLRVFIWLVWPYGKSSLPVFMVLSDSVSDVAVCLSPMSAMAPLPLISNFLPAGLAKHNHWE